MSLHNLQENITNEPDSATIEKLKQDISEILDELTYLNGQLSDIKKEDLDHQSLIAIAKRLAIIQTTLFTTAEITAQSSPTGFKISTLLPKEGESILETQDSLLIDKEYLSLLTNQFLEKVIERLLIILEEVELTKQTHQLPDKPLQEETVETKRRQAIEDGFNLIIEEFNKVAEYQQKRQNLLKRKILILALIDREIVKFAEKTKSKRDSHAQKMQEQKKSADDTYSGKVQNPSIATLDMTSFHRLTDANLNSLRNWISTIKRQDIRWLSGENITGTGPLGHDKSKERYRNFSQMLGLLHVDPINMHVQIGEGTRGKNENPQSQAEIVKFIFDHLLDQEDPEKTTNDDAYQERLAKLQENQKNRDYIQFAVRNLKLTIYLKAQAIAGLTNYVKVKHSPSFIKKVFAKVQRGLQGEPDPEKDVEKSIDITLGLIQNFSQTYDAGDTIDVLLAALVEIQEQYDKLETQHTIHHSVEDYLLKKRFFAVDPENKFNDVFVKMYDFIATVGIVANHDYDPETMARVLSKISIIQVFQAARFNDKDGIGADRSLVGSLIRDYFKATLTLFKKPTDLDHIEKLLNAFWINEIGRPEVIFARNPETNEILRDEKGLAIIEALEHNFLTGSLTTTEYATYPINQEINPEITEILQNADQPLILASFVYQQLDMMINHRRDRKPEKIGLFDCPLPKRDKYAVVIVQNNQWKKIYVSWNELQTGPKSKLLYQIYGQIQNQEGYKPIPTNLKSEIDEAYSGKISYQEIEPQILDLENFAAADFRVTLTQDSELENMEHWHNNILGNTFQGKTQIAFMLGENDGCIKNAAANISHKFIDGMEFRKQFSQVMRHTLRDSIAYNHLRATQPVEFATGTNRLANSYQIPATIEYIYLLSQNKPISNEYRVSSHPVDKAIIDLEKDVESQHFTNNQQKITYLQNKIAKYKKQLTQYKHEKIRQQQPLPQSEKEKYFSNIRETILTEKDTNLRSRSNEIFKFYNDKFGYSIDRNAIIQMAIMMTLKTEHSHFLESKKGLLAPAICILSNHLQDAILDPSKFVLNPDLIAEAAVQAQIMKISREAIKNKDFDPTRVMAILPGLHSSSHKQREAITKAGLLLNKAVAGKAGKTCMSSFVTGTRQPLEEDVYSNQSKFATALSDVYMDMGVIGVSDYKNDLAITYRYLNGTETREFAENKEFGDEFLININAILQFFEYGMIAFQETPSVYEQNREPWLDFFRSPEYDKNAES